MVKNYFGLMIKMVCLMKMQCISSRQVGYSGVLLEFNMIVEYT